MRRIFRITGIVLALLAVVYLLGPKPAPPDLHGTLPQVPAGLEQVAAYVDKKEGAVKTRPGNRARIVWAGDSLHKTPYSIVYLHGFSASEREGFPVHTDFAKKHGFNLYLSRLDGHGLETPEPLEHMTAQGLLKDAREALAIGKQLGDKVIVIGTSTGGTLALMLAAEFPDDVEAVVNMSPNIAINQPMARMLDEPWGLMAARLVRRGKYDESTPKNPEKAKYWYTKYRLEAVVELENLVEHTMRPELFARIHQPVLNLYYYKNEKEQDPTVKVSAILSMHEQLGTPPAKKRAVAIPGAGAHVIGSSITSGDVPGVEAAIEAWWQDMYGN